MVIAVGLARLTSFAIGSCSMERDLNGFSHAAEPPRLDKLDATDQSPYSSIELIFE